RALHIGYEGYRKRIKKEGMVSFVTFSGGAVRNLSSVKRKIRCFTTPLYGYIITGAALKLI
ncbi:MAG TPA: hypothetical protein PLZ53_06380, partial [Candidatus Hydrogenedentes bacterium]|nr:hypothetical protein [Candidatus Hydrogenedentota bacterium]